MAVALSGDRQVLTPSDFPLSASRDLPPGTHTVAVLDDGLDDVNTVANFERSLLEQPLQKTGGNEKTAAEINGLKRTTLSAKVRRLDPAA